ncbi:hypothetical protein PCANC_04240 [Puccinia coronata f. sp. avenae]|uniref:Uncharacterized protein n=2 Tax=Puccinia coronata f. sp. avenae TaxID=200324 RepID=A0A2N5VX20_9BASI|nr:hypothetical protein PCANC_04240 [Puccinia coronata f. sp. avenae]
MRIQVWVMVWSFWLMSNPSRADASREGGEQQQVLSSSVQARKGETDKSNANLIFSSFAGLLQQWPNTFAYSGHSIIPGIVPRATLLYHGTNDTNGPPKEGLEWLAFDPEMSYRIASIRPGDTSLYTYVATHPLRVIYFDGQSASLGTPGFMDSQFAIINASVPEIFPDLGHFIEAEYARATALCKLADKYGFEGVVRMNTGFELLWLLNVINVTDPFTDNVPASTTKSHPAHKIFAPNYLRHGRQSPLSRGGFWNAVHSGSQHFFAPGEVRVILDPEGFISFYDGLESLNAKRRSDGTSGGPRSRHRLYGISKEDARTVQERLVEVLGRKNSENWRADPGRPDWRAVVLTIVDRYSPLLGELDYLLNRADLNATVQAIEVRTLTYDLIMPSLDFSDWNSPEPGWLVHGIRRCTRAYTSAPLTPSDLSRPIRMIIRSIEGTLERLCGKMYDLFEQTILLHLPITPSLPFNSTLEVIARSKIPAWREEVESLQKWLGWSTWAHCQPRCKNDEICMPPLWPMLWGKVITNLTNQFPICLNSSSSSKIL